MGGGATGASPLVYLDTAHVQNGGEASSVLSHASEISSIPKTGFLAYHLEEWEYRQRLQYMWLAAVYSGNNKKDREFIGVQTLPPSRPH